MALLQEWQKISYNQEQDRATLQRFWQNYFLIDIMAMTGFLDGINDSLITPNPIETMEEDTVVSLVFDKEKLYENMVDAKADWLYELPQWDEIFDADKKKTLYREAKNAHTIRNTVKVGRNDPCPCGSGRKYKQCCGKKNK